MQFAFWALFVTVLVSACQSVTVAPSIWEIQGTVDPADDVLDIAVVGAACDGSTPSSEIDRIEVVEGVSSITITVWVRTSLPRFGDCTAVGIVLAESVELSQPVADRQFIDGGVQP